MSARGHSRSRRLDSPSDAPRYEPPPPELIRELTLDQLIRGVRDIPLAQERRLVAPTLFPGDDAGPRESPTLYCVGEPELVRRRCVAVVGSREASDEGKRRAKRLAAELVARDVVVVSGLAEGIDASAHVAAIESGGQTVAVIGTPVDRAYPAANAALQSSIWRHHLLISPFQSGTPTYRSSFPHRNKLMAALTDATVIVEASDTSGSLHQAAECLRIGRWLFIGKSLVDRRELEWPKKFLDSADRGARVRILVSTAELVREITS